MIRLFFYIFFFFFFFFGLLSLAIKRTRRELNEASGANLTKERTNKEPEIERSTTLGRFGYESERDRFQGEGREWRASAVPRGACTGRGARYKKRETWHETVAAPDILTLPFASEHASYFERRARQVQKQETNGRNENGIKRGARMKTSNEKKGKIEITNTRKRLPEIPTDRTNQISIHQPSR